MNIDKKYIYAGGVALLCIAIIGALLVGRSSNKTGRAAVQLEEERNRAAASGGSGADVAAADPTGVAKKVREAEVATPEIMMLQFQLQFRYPPESRPLTRGMTDLTDPFRILPSKHPIYAHNPPGPDEKPAMFYSWSGPSYVITGTTPAVATLEVFDDAGNRVTPRITTAEVLSDFIFGRKVVGQATSEVSSDGKTTVRWTPRTGDRLHWGEMELRVSFDTTTIKNSQVITSFNSTPTPPAEFTGDYSERIESGSLVIDAPINVKKPGKYIFDANIFDADGEPYGRVHSVLYLERGVQRLPLTFFGIIFHDREFNNGKLVLKNLRGRRMNLPFDPRKLDEMLSRGDTIPTNNEPLEEWIPNAASDYVTKRSYDVDEFAKKEYEGTDKADRRKQLEQYAKTWQEQHG